MIGEGVFAVLLVVLLVAVLGFTLFVLILALCQGAVVTWRAMRGLRVRWATRHFDQRVNAAIKQWSSTSASGADGGLRP